MIVQCMRQYTENSLGCSTAKYTNVGGGRQITTQSWKPFFCQRYRYGQLRCRYVKLSVSQLAVSLHKLQYAFRRKSIYQSLCNRRHTLSVLRFLLPKKPEPIHFLRAMRSSNSFSFFTISLARVDFSLVNLRIVFSADGFRCEHRRFYIFFSVGFVSYVLAAKGPRGELLKKQTSFLVQHYARLARIELQYFTSLFSSATISLARLHEMHETHTHNTRPFFKWYASEPTKDKLNRDKMAG